LLSLLSYPWTFDDEGEEREDEVIIIFTVIGGDESEILKLLNSTKK
jgi:hypothetical protein